MNTHKTQSLYYLIAINNYIKFIQPHYISSRPVILPKPYINRANAIRTCLESLIVSQNYNS